MPRVAMAAARVVLIALALRSHFLVGYSDDDVSDIWSVSLLQASLETNSVVVRHDGGKQNATQDVEETLAELDLVRSDMPKATSEALVNATEGRPVAAASPAGTGGGATSSHAAPSPPRGVVEHVDSASNASSIRLSACIGWTILALGLFGCAYLIAKHWETDEQGMPTFRAKLKAEFIGTFMLIFSVGCNVLVGNETWGVVGIASTLMVLVYALGGISGANFNPAVSLALGMSGKMQWPIVLAYTLTQFAAAILAGQAYVLMLDKTFSLGPKQGFTTMQAGMAEVLYTFMLCFCVLNTACSKKHAKDQFYGLAIGFCVVAGGYGGGAISGGCFNPAVALGIDTSSRGFGNFFVYWAFESVGALFASALYRVCRPDDYTEEVMTEYPTYSKLTAEFLGTFMLIVTVGLNALAPNGPEEKPGSKAAVFSIASSLMCMIYALGSCSGAHFNPAVTLAMCLRGACSRALGLWYVLVQLVAGIVAAATFILLENGHSVPLRPVRGALVGEFVFTFLLVYVVLCVTTVRSALSQYFGLAIGSCVTAGGLAIGSLSGGCLNPAASAGLGLTSGSVVPFVNYSLVQLLAGVVAAELFAQTHAAEIVKGETASHHHTLSSWWHANVGHHLMHPEQNH